MKKISTAICIGIALCTTSAFAKDMAKAKSMNAVFIEAKDLEWKDVAGYPGLQQAVVEGDTTKGPHHSLMKFKAGFSAPMHHHTAPHYVTVVSGNFILTVDGVEHRLPAGSYFSFKNKQKHSTMCAEGADCIISADVRGKWDVVPEKQTISSK